MRKIILSIIVFTSLVKNNVTAQYWSALGTGIGGSGYSGGESVLTMKIYNGELYAGGLFDLAGGVPVNGIAKWNGTNWSAVGSGNSGLEICRTLVVHNGELYAGGYFWMAGDSIVNNIAKWNGISWSPLGSGVGEEGKSAVHSLVVYNEELYVAGSFIRAGNVTANNIAKWNGTSWSALGTGIGGWEESVLSLAVYNGELYAGGEFTDASGVPANGIAKWNGTNWSSVGTGMNGGVGSLVVFNGELYAGGAFTNAGGISAHCIAKWNGITWSPLGSGIHGYVTSTKVHNGVLYVGGGFDTAGGNPANNIAKWDGTNWSALGTGITSNWNYSVVKSLASDNDFLYAGGYFTNAGGIEAKSIAKWIDHCIAAPSTPGTINGNSSICQGSSQTYSINPVSGAANYTWTLPYGWTGSSTSNSITIIAGTNGGIISVTANNSCEASNPQTIIVTTDSVPAMPSFINGNDTVCDGSSQTYYIDSVPGATDYAWDLTFGWVSGLNSTNITITVDHNGYVDDLISVSAYNNCGYSDLQILPVTVNLLPQHPNGIIGNTTVCRGSTQTYFINPVYSATSYTWTLPPGWVGISNSSLINITAGNEPGEISVIANNNCGSRTSISLPIRLDTIPSKPSDITGNVYVNAGQSQSYSINLLNGVSGYNWSLSGGGNIITGQNTTKIEINWQTPGTYVLTVNATNSCGVSADQTITIKVSAANIEDPFSLQLFPNPSSGEFYLKAKRVQNKMISIEVLNMTGQLVFRSGKKQGANDYTQLINLDKMPQGIYAVKIMVDDKVYVRPVAIKRQL